MPLAYIHWINVPGLPSGPVDPGYSPPWAQVPPGSGPGGPVDPGYSPPWAQVPPGGSQPPGIWGPNDPRPTHPISGWNPGTGTFPPGGGGQPPLGMWGPNDPRPTHPIAGWNPGTGTFPPGGGQAPPGFWGPNDPRPTNPIAGWDPATGNFPKPPITNPSPIPPKPEEELPPGGTAPTVPPEVDSTQPVLVFIPTYGWYWVMLAPPAPPTEG